MRNWIRSSMLALLLPVLPLSAQTPAKTDNEKKSESAEKKPETPPEKPFADVVKDAKVVKGLFIFYKTEDKVFLERVQKRQSPYGDGRAGERIAEILASVRVGPELLEKRLTY